MTLSSLLLFIPACFALNMAPGPNNLLSLSNATRHGLRPACLAGIGRLLAFAGMLALTSAGLAVVLHGSEWVFNSIRVVGAAYLFYLAIQLWRADPAQQLAGDAPKANLLGLGRQEFLVAAGNPKAILIFTAFLPQFVDPTQPMVAQFAVLGGLFLLLEWVAIVIYGYMGVHMRRWFSAPRSRRLFNRSCGVLLGGAGAGLLAAHRG